MQFTFGFVTLVLALSASAAPSRMQKVKVSRRAEFDLKNGQDAIALKYVPRTPSCPELRC